MAVFMAKPVNVTRSREYLVHLKTEPYYLFGLCCQILKLSWNCWCLPLRQLLNRININKIVEEVNYPALESSVVHLFPLCPD